MYYPNCPFCKGIFTEIAKIITESDDGIKTYHHRWFQCKKCRKKYYSLATEYVFDDSLDYYMYEVEENIWTEHVKLIKKCKQKNNPLCNCDSHKLAKNVGYENFICTDYTLRSEE
ncbi:MAG: hypothetical protein A2Y34_05825 [Spirochaetes bacterium GWC1_27_15]|nr:MAG: hypothetical protein A2Y34_05825 [Spirochaetes bacterium GWC1_27_15]